MKYNSFFPNIKTILFLIILCLNRFKLIESATSCSKKDQISNKNCFNNVLIFNNMKCRAGHSALNKDGLFILEFSNDGETGTRVFYGLQPNGRYYFSDESPIKEVTLTAKNGVIARYESINAFVALSNDINKKKEYFLSISTYKCFMEIYDITKDNIDYDAIYNGDYLGNQIFSFRFELFETKYDDAVTYYLVFCHSTNYDGQGDKLSVKKITFSNPSFNTNDIIKTTTMDNKLNDRGISGILLDDQDDENYRLLIVVYERTPNTNTLISRYNFNVYKLSDLSAKCSGKELYDNDLTTNHRGDQGKGYGVFFKFIYLGNRDSAMAYYKTNQDGQKLFFQVLTVKSELNCDSFFGSKIYLEINENLKTDLVMNDFIKLNETRLAFISTKDTNKLFIMLMDLYNDNKNIQTRTY